MEFQTYHRYNKLVRRGMAKPLTHGCGHEYTLRLSEDNDVVLQCTDCNTLVQPGLRLYNDVQAVVREHFE